MEPLDYKKIAEDILGIDESPFFTFDANELKEFVKSVLQAAADAIETEEIPGSMITDDSGVQHVYNKAVWDARDAVYSLTYWRD